MLQLLAVVHVILSIALVGLILMHSGRDTGFGGMGFTPASQGGTHIVERNLTLADQAELAEVASAAGMDIVGPPLSDEEVAAIVGGERV